MASVKWMWSDAGLGYAVERLNPLRWSKSKSIQETVAELESCKDEDKGRPLVLRIWDAATKEQWYENVSKAVEGLLKVIEFVDLDGHQNTIMHSLSLGLDWNSPLLGKRTVHRLHIHTRTSRRFSIGGPFGFAVVKEPAPGPAQADLVQRLIASAEAASVPVEGPGLKVLSDMNTSGPIPKAETSEENFSAEVPVVSFKEGFSVHIISNLDGNKLKWTEKGSNSTTKDVEELRVELGHNSEDRFEITGPFGKVVTTEPKGAKLKVQMNMLLNMAEKAKVYAVVGTGAVDVLGRAPPMGKTEDSLDDGAKASLSFVLKPGILDAIVNSDHPGKVWWDKAKSASKEGKEKEAADALQRCQLEVYHDVVVIKASFDFFDKDHTGTLKLSELCAALVYLGYPSEDADCDKMQKEMDIDKNGDVSLEEFQTWVLKHGGIKKVFRKQSFKFESMREEAKIFALREAGITESSLSFWSPTLNISERLAVVELTADQRHAVAHTRAVSEHFHRRALPEVIEKAQNMGYEEKDVFKVLDYLRESASLLVHLNLDRKIGTELLIDKLISDTHYRNQFETGVSGGALSQETRRRWEHDLFGDAYDKTKGFDRCKYGVLNTTFDPRGVKCCRQYGDSYLVLKDARLRTTFSPCDSGGIKAESLSCCDFYANVLNDYNSNELDVTMKVGSGKELWYDSDAISQYKEAQYHGEVALGRHVVRLVAAERHKKQEDVKFKIAAACKKHGFELVWMDELEEERKKAGKKLREDREKVAALRFVEVRELSWQAAVMALQSKLIEEKVPAGQVRCVDAHSNPRGKEAMLTAFWEGEAASGEVPSKESLVDLQFALHENTEKGEAWPEMYKWACTECTKLESGCFISVTCCCGFAAGKQNACLVFWDANAKSGTPKMRLTWEQSDDKGDSWLDAAKSLQDKVCSLPSLGKTVGIDAHNDGPGTPSVFVAFLDKSSEEDLSKNMSLAFKRQQSASYGWNEFYIRAVDQVRNASPVSITSSGHKGNYGVTFAWFFPKSPHDEVTLKRGEKVAKLSGQAEAKRARVDDVAMSSSEEDLYE